MVLSVVILSSFSSVVNGTVCCLKKKDRQQTIPLTKEEKEERQTTDNTIDKRRERRKTDNRQYH
jgi:hypothetical protein